MAIPSERTPNSLLKVPATLCRELISGKLVECLSVDNIEEEADKIRNYIYENPSEHYQIIFQAVRRGDVGFY